LSEECEENTHFAFLSLFLEVCLKFDLLMCNFSTAHKAKKILRRNVRGAFVENLVVF
jgi:hypothetical protein